MEKVLLALAAGGLLGLLNCNPFPNHPPEARVVDREAEEILRADSLRRADSLHLQLLADMSMPPAVVMLPPKKHKK